jgi:hypothetical protein
MALKPKQVPLTREVVQGWVDEYQKLKKKPPIETFFADKINALQLPDTMVDTEYHDDLEAETPILQMILSDLPSYGLSS